MIKYVNKLFFDKRLYIDKKLFDSFNKSNSEYSIKLIKYLLNNNYNKLKAIFSEFKPFDILLIQRNNLLFNRKKASQVHIVYKKNFIKSVEFYKLQNLLNSDEIKKYEYLKNCLTQEYFEENYKSINYFYNNKYNTYNFKELFQKLKMKPEEFKYEYLNNKLGINIKDDEIDYLLNSFVDVLGHNEVYFDANVIENYEFLKENIKKVNYNKLSLGNNPKYTKKGIVNEELKKIILHNIPDNFNKLEKAFYIYLKMCSILDYDEDFAIAISYDNISNEANTSIHNDINNLPNITYKNNKVICQEFCLIYAKMLDEIGIDYEIVGSNNYEDGHPKIHLLYDNCIFEADPTISVIDSDICFVKNGIKAKEFSILTKDIYAKERFNKSIEKVYNYISSTYNIKYKTLRERFYKDQDKYKQLSFNEKITYLNKRISLFKTSNISKCFFVKCLARALFLDDLDISYIVEKQKDSKKNMAIILSIKVDNEYKFYKYSNNKLEEYTKEELKNRFNFRDFERILSKKRIQGFDEKKHEDILLELNQLVLKINK